jgi:hypothetical protein
LFLTINLLELKKLFRSATEAQVTPESGNSVALLARFDFQSEIWLSVIKPFISVLFWHGLTCNTSTAYDEV